ncbi:MAG: hypothetical protein CMN84_11245 [Spongiibacteraceae bacterium]|nr:hypothetical protein [Spongiibacteraceae bacterium]
MINERAALTVIGFSLVGLGLAYLIVPGMMLSLTGEFQLNSQALLDVRATYGGIQLGLGAFLLTEVVRGGSLESSLRMVVWAFTCVGGIRLGMDLSNGEGLSLHFWVGLGELLLAAGVSRLRTVLLRRSI